MRRRRLLQAMLSLPVMGLTALPRAETSVALPPAGFTTVELEDLLYNIRPTESPALMLMKPGTYHQLHEWTEDSLKLTDVSCDVFEDPHIHVYSRDGECACGARRA